MEIPTYREIFLQNPHFQRAVNLSMDLGDVRFLEGYIPNRPSCEVLSRYLSTVLNPGAERASVLIGPYGKGKSYTLFLVLSILSDFSPEFEAAISRVTQAMEQVDPEAAALVRTVRGRKLRMLPVVINDRYLDVRQAFLASLRNALAQAGMEHLMPENYFQQALATISRWKEKYQSTFQAYDWYLNRNGSSPSEMESRLKQYDSQALDLFRECHREILSGTEFNPLLESDVPSLYEQVLRLLCQEEGDTGYSGIFVVFDEFGKYLESSADSQKAYDFKMLQDLAEIAGRSTTPGMILTCVSHKSISEYASRLSENQLNSFRTIEGRFTPIWFNASLQGSFEMIAGALGRREEEYSRFEAAYRPEIEEVSGECERLNCFSEYGERADRIVDLCLPMHPLTALAVMKLSELAAQNERTFFTFLTDPASPLTCFLKGHQGGFVLATVDMVYDYFHETIRENSYDPKLRQLITYTDSLLPGLSQDEGKLVRAIALFSMLGDARVRAVPRVLRAGLQWTEERLKGTVQGMEKDYRIYTRHSDGVLCLMQNSSEAMRREIESRKELQRGRVDLAQELTQMADPGYTIPRRYNDEREMVRYFRNVYLTREEFFRERTSGFLKKRGTADGYVLYLLEDADEFEVQKQLKGWDDKCILVVLPSVTQGLWPAVEESAAIRLVMEETQDRVEREELTYYLEDMVTVAKETLEKMFAEAPLCVTMEDSGICRNVGRKVSEICQWAYDRTPTICHEMMNRNVLSQPMCKVRIRIIDAILENRNYLGLYTLNTAEGVAMRAIVGEMDKGFMPAVVAVLEDFFAGCGREPQPLAELYQKLTAPPYGLRLGVIPVLIARVLREKRNQVTLYAGDREIRFQGSNLSNLDTHVDQYRILVDCESREQQEYLKVLSEACTPKDPIVSMENILEVLTRRVRNLPSAARNNSRTLLHAGGKPGHSGAIPSWITGIRSQLIPYNLQPRKTLLQNLPEQAGMEISGECARRVLDALKYLEHYLTQLRKDACTIVLRQLKASPGDSVRQAATRWLEQLGPEQRQRAYDGRITAVLKVMDHTDSYPDDQWWVSELAKAVTRQNMEDWRDRHIENFEKQLQAIIDTVEKAGGERDMSGSASIQVKMGGRVIQQSLEDQELGDLGSAVYDQISFTLDEYNESISVEEKLRVLMKVILSLTGEK